MRPIFVVIALMVSATTASSADFQATTVQAPNFVLLGDPIDYHIIVAPGATTASGDPLVEDPLPAGLAYIDATLTCYVPDGSCQYTPAPPTITYTGTMNPYTAADIYFSASSSGLPASGYVHNQVTFSATGFNTVQKSRTTVVYTSDEWPVCGDALRLSETDADWHASECTGVAWNPVAEVFSAVWIRTDQMSSQRYLQTRTIDPAGNLGPVQQVNQIIPGETPQEPGIACASSSGRCLVAWLETEPVMWERGIRTRLLDDTGIPIGNEAVVVEGDAYFYDPRVVYNPDLDEFLVVYWTEWPTGVVDVTAQRVRASDGLLLSSAVVATGTDFERKDARAAHLQGHDRYLIAYTCEDAAENEKVCATIAAGDLTGLGPEFDIVTPGTDDAGPAVGAAGDEYLVAWKSQQTWQDPMEIRARRVAADGTPLGSTSGFLVSGFQNVPGASVRDVQFVGEQGFLVGWYHSDPSSVTGSDHHGRFVELGEDQPAYLEFPTFATNGMDSWGSFACNHDGQCLIAVEITDGVDARLVAAWRAHIDGFEDGGFGGWDAVVGASQ